MRLMAAQRYGYFDNARRAEVKALIGKKVSSDGKSCLLAGM
jgi:hypothetical protein